MTKWIPTIAWTFVVVLAVGCAPEDWDPTAGSTYAATACTAIPCHDGCLAAGHLGGDCRGTSCLCYDEDPTVPSRDDGITPDGESCYNGVDDNGDLLVDCADPACCNTRECFGSEECGGCVPTLEECSGELDEDCDGLVDCLDPNCAPDPACDPGCQDELQTCHVGHCNGYIGEMIDEWTEVAECMTHNDGGCSDDELYAWCSRYWDTGVGGAWYDFIHDWVASRCVGEVVWDEDAGTYTCRDEEACITYQCTTPLVLAFDDATRVAYRGDSGCRGFDLAAKGAAPAVTTDWPTAATPWLAYDRDGDGAIGSADELFGSATPVVGGLAKHGFEALAALDADRDGAVAPDDPAFGSLELWADRDGDRVSSPDELQPLGSAGVLRLEVGYTAEPRCDARGNCEVERGAFVWADGAGRLHRGAVIDVHLPVR